MFSRMPKPSPRYSPVGSRLSVKPNDCSHPTLSVPPAETWLFVWLDFAAEPAATTTTAAIAVTPSTAMSLRIGTFTFCVSLLPRATLAEDCSDRTIRLLLAAIVSHSTVRPHVECIAEAVAEQIEGKRCDHEEQAREEHQPPGNVVI